MLRNNHNWVDVAKDAGLDLWERQPQETNHEYAVWVQYRDMYPATRPSYKELCEQTGMSYNAIKKISNRWNFATRMQAWVQHVDEITMLQRQQEILDMNKKHVDMAATLNEKISKAIEQIDPYELSPKDINALMKTATELERKGRLDQELPSGMFVEEKNTEVKNHEVKTSDINEILKILGGAGVLGNAGVRQTVTTEVVVKGDEN